MIIYSVVFFPACLGHSPLDVDQSLCYLGIITFLRYFLSSLGRHHLVTLCFIYCSASMRFMLMGSVWESPFLFSFFFFFLSLCFQALLELPEDVLRVYADVVQRSGLAQHHPPHYSQFAARCHQKGPLQGRLSHSHRTCTGRKPKRGTWHCLGPRIN